MVINIIFCGNLKIRVGVAPTIMSPTHINFEDGALHFGGVSARRSVRCGPAGGDYSAGEGRRRGLGEEGVGMLALPARCGLGYQLVPEEGGEGVLEASGPPGILWREEKENCNS